MKKLGWIVFALLCIAIGLYPGIYFLIDGNFGLLETKSIALLTNMFWNVGFYTHITLGGFALLIGWTQFINGIRDNNLTLHRLIGKLYIVSVFLSSMAGICIAFFATGGVITSAGFICLGGIWFYTTLMAYRSIRNLQIAQHQKMMIYSYAACFAAVTLRVWLPILTILFGEFIPAYRLVAWLCWVPNIMVAYLITRNIVDETVSIRQSKGTVLIKS